MFVISTFFYYSLFSKQKEQNQNINQNLHVKGRWLNLGKSGRHKIIMM